MTGGIVNIMSADWARTLVDPAAFEDEQACLGQVWTFLGLTSDLANDGDWFRATLAARSVFVQRFGDDLVGFENRCAHRSYPLRNADRGNGPIVCGFHHWRYNKSGRAVGIPLCTELFGATPRELNAQLIPVEIATCGAMIFGRFRGEGATESLEVHLDLAFPILRSMSNPAIRPAFITRSVRANWRLCFHASVDDYHIVAVHPTTVGKAGYIHRDQISYFRYGLHSAYFATAQADALADMARACREGVWRSEHYRVFHLFPNLAVVHFQADGERWYIAALQYAPLAMDRSQMRVWIYPAPFPANAAWHDRWTRPFTDPVREMIVRRSVNRILSEDNEVCERQQSIASQMRGSVPILGALEERLAWFEEAYARTMTKKHGVRDGGGNRRQPMTAAITAGLDVAHPETL